MPQEQAPAFTPGGGSYAAPLSVTLGGVSGGALVCYSLNGTPAIANGQCGSGSSAYAGPITVPGSGATLSAIASGPGLLPSAVVSATYNVLRPAISLSVPSVTFGPQRAGVPSAVQVVTLSNTGAATLNLSGIVLGGTNSSAFMESDTCQQPLNVGASCAITVSFLPASAGQFSAALQIAGSTASSPATLALTGTGIAPAVSLSVPELSFANTDVGFTADAQTVTLLNSGSAPLLVSGIAIGGSGAAAFIETNNCGATLAPSASCAVNVKFVPESAAAMAAQLSFSDDASPTTQSVPLTGEGTPDTPLSVWNDAYRHCTTRVVNVVVLGDSRAIVDTTIVPTAAASLADTFGQKWADRLRTTLEAHCGSHGSGLVPMLPLAGTTDLNGDYYQGTGTWGTAQGPGPYQFGGVPAGMALVATSPVTLQFTSPEPFDHLNAYCMSGPGLSPWVLTLDGANVGTCGGENATTQAVVASSSAVPLGPHLATLVCAQAPCEAYGMEATSGSVGVSVHNLAVGGCAAECFGLDPASQLAFSDLINGGQQLVVLGLITNDPGVGYSVDSFTASLENIIDHERALPELPSVLIYAPLQDNLPGQGPYYPVLPAVATQFGTAYFDVRETYGAAFLPQYFGPDGTHENNAGHALIYNGMVSALLP